MEETSDITVLAETYAESKQHCLWSGDVHPWGTNGLKTKIYPCLNGTHTLYVGNTKYCKISFLFSLE